MEVKSLRIEIQESNLKVKLNEELVKRYAFHLGGDMSETLGIAVNHSGEPITYEEFKESGGTVKPIHVLELTEEFLVVEHESPIPVGEYDKFKCFFEEK